MLLILNFSLLLEQGMCDLRAQMRLCHEPTELKFLDTSRTLIQWPDTELTFHKYRLNPERFHRTSQMDAMQWLQK